MDRIAVHGASGSGKTSLARALAERLDVKRTELDALYHQPGWTRLPDAEFRARVSAAVAGERWVVDGNYRVVRDLVWARADCVIVLDLPRLRVMRQLVTRSVVRSAVHRELWNGNRESFRNLFSTDADRNVVLWSWRTWPHYHAELVSEARTGAPHARLLVVHSRREADALVESLASGTV